MEQARPLSLTPAGRPVLDADTDEGELVVQDNVSLYDRDTKSDYRNGLAMLTTHRVCWLDPRRAGHRCKEFPLAIVSKAEKAGKFFMSSAKVTLHFGGSAYVKLSFHDGGEGPFHDNLVKALERKDWTRTPHSARKVAGAGAAAGGGSKLNASHAGIGGLVHRHNAIIEGEKGLASEAFEHINALMYHARDIVDQAKKIAKAAARDGDGGGGADDSKFDSMLLDIGIANPVTKETTGARYHQELARQLSDFVRKPLDRAGGVLVLPDVYCMYNRARGSDLVSPDDLLAACKLLDKLHLGMRLRTYTSGVAVVEAASYSDEAVSRRLEAALRSSDYLTAMSLSAAWRVPMPVAREQLLSAEQRGQLCRDDTIRGLRFYPNRFKDL